MSEPSLLAQSLRLVRRELRGGPRGFGVFLACLFLGVFAISAVGSFTASARSGLLADAGALLGGDLEVRLVHRELTPEQRDFLERRGEISRVVGMRSMAGPAASDARTLVELKAVDQAYPLYGRIELAPDQPLSQALAPAGDLPGAVVERALLQRLHLAVGDRLRIGEAVFVVRAVIAREPDRSLRAFTLGPRVMIDEAGLRATGLLRPGSLVTCAYRLRLPRRESAEALKDDLQTAFPEAGWRLSTWRQAAPRVRQFLDRMGLNLTLLGLCALLVGGLGVSGAVRGYLGGKISHIATMKCLGASGRIVFTTYLLQILILGAVGAGCGLIAGAAVPFVVSRLAGDRLPFPLVPDLFPGILVSAALFGLLVALAFSLRALGIARRVSPGILFRGYGRAEGGDPGTAVRIAIAAAVLLLASLVVATSADRSLALWFILGAAGCFGIFHLLSAGLIRAARRLPRPGNPRLRLSLANIHRPGSPATSAVFSLGLGLTSLVIIALVHANLDDLVTETVPAEAPAFFFFDIQPDQTRPFEEALRRLPQVSRVEQYPTLRGRITAIDGTPVEETTIDPEVRWAVRGDRYLSYSAAEPAGAKLTAGRWWPPGYSGPPLISLTADLAKGFGIGIGDTLTVNVLGRDITAEIASLREVDWSTLELNFAILLSPGVLEDVPQTHIAAVHVPPSGEEQVFREITGRFPNVSAISVREVLGNVSRTIDRIGGAFRAMAALALLTGFLVLAGAVSADQHRRIHDAVIFKVCGATRGDILATFAYEFLLLGLAAGLISAAVGSLAALAIVTGPLEAAFSLHPAIILLTLGAGLTLTLVLGLAGTWKALGQKPAAWLREE